MALEGKYQIELNYPGDGRKFINFWNWENGDDVCCEIVYGKLMRLEYDDAGDKLPASEINFNEFVRLVEERISGVSTLRNV